MAARPTRKRSTSTPVSKTDKNPQKRAANSFEQIDRSLVAIFDIEDFSKRSPEVMAQLVRTFLNTLSNQLQELGDLLPDSFSTGDGAIVSIGRRCHIDANNTQRFVRFAIELTLNLCRNDVIVRTALNYSEGDRIVFGTPNALKGQYIQVGDTINVAARVLTFCEPRELMVTATLQTLLRNHELQDKFPFHHNEPLVTKHGLKLDTYTYVPPADPTTVLYTPDAPLHRYKRFTAFPPLKPQTLAQFLESGLDTELRKVVSNAYDAMSYINETKTFLSASEVLQVLTRPNYDPGDTVCVVSRNDQRNGFWTQKRRHQYVTFLSDNAKRHGGHINQTRILVYNDDTGSDQPEDDITTDLKRLHAPTTLRSFPLGLLHRYEQIRQLIFGFTLSRKHRYAIIPVPGADLIEPSKLRPEALGELLGHYKNYDATDGPMKAIITADPAYIDALSAEFDNLLQDPSAHVAK